MAADPPVSFVADEFSLLLTCFAQVQDGRKARGKVHPLTSLLALTVLGLMAGKPSLSALATWAKKQPQAWQALGLRRCPAVATFWRLLQQVSVEEVREALLTFSVVLRSRRLPASSGAPEDPGVPGTDGVVAMDGKTLRGVTEAGAHLQVLHLFATESALLLDQCALAGHFAEPAAAQQWLTAISARFPGLQVLTGDALYAERSLCAALVAAQKDYVVRVKKTNRSCTPTLRTCSPTPPRPA